MKQGINQVLRELKIQPVLVDIGASGTPPPQWRSIAPHSIYVGFDPDQRNPSVVPDIQFARSIIVNQAISSVPSQSEAHFYLTRSPFCSSTLQPNVESLTNYLFSDLFAVEKKVLVPASSLNAQLNRLELERIDWFKTDSQGTDLRLFEALTETLRHGVLAVDIEPGLIDAYQGEDLFVDAHRELTHQGFWLSSLEVKGTVRMKRATLEAVMTDHPDLRDTHLYQSVRPSPGWCEARYLRTLESLRTRNAGARDYALLWVFTMMEQQWGYALDIAHAYQQQFGQDNVSTHLLDLPLKEIYSRNHGLRAFAKRFLPKPLKAFLKQLVLG